MAASYPSPRENVMAYEEIFHPLDAAALEQEGAISPPGAGTRKVNKRRLEKSSEDYLESADLVQTFGELSLEEVLTLPDVLYSEQTYEYCGFTATAASELWNLYLANIDQFPDLDETGTREYFLSFASAMIDEVAQPSGSLDDSEWKAAFSKMGLNNATQDLIMLEDFSDIRQTESAVF